jgi:hypothetical protein
MEKLAKNGQMVQNSQPLSPDVYGTLLPERQVLMELD